VSYSLVGSLGAVSVGAVDATVTPAYGQTPTVNHLLLCWLVGSNGINPSTPTGWSLAEHDNGATLFYKIAAGGDASPSFAAATNNQWIAQVGEFAGNVTSSPLDQVGESSFVTSNQTSSTAAAAAADAGAGELVAVCTMFYNTFSTSGTGADSLNNGATANTTTGYSNASSESGVIYDFCWGVTTGNSSADSDTSTITGGAPGAYNGSMVIASFKAAPPSFTPTASPRSFVPLVVPNWFKRQSLRRRHSGLFVPGFADQRLAIAGAL